MLYCKTKPQNEALLWFLFIKVWSNISKMYNEKYIHVYYEHLADMVYKYHCKTHAKMQNTINHANWKFRS